MRKTSWRKIHIALLVMPVGFVLVLLFTSWKKNQVNSLETYTRWLNEKENGCLASQRIAGVNVTVKFQPFKYVVLKDLGSQSIPADKQAIADSMMAKQKKLLTFLMVIGPDEQVPEQRRASSIMKEGVTDYGSYTQRVVDANFFMDECASMYIGGKKYKPVMTLMDNVYELSENRTFTIVFAPDAADDITDCVFEYDDKIFGVGKIQYPFSAETITTANNVLKYN